MRRVFVSYSRTNLGAVTQLIKHGKDVGIEMWYDQALTGGQRWWDNILDRIRDCDIFIFALSPESWDSEACKSELAYVVQLGKPIIPVLISDGININLLSAPLSEIQITDYRKRDMEAAPATAAGSGFIFEHPERSHRLRGAAEPAGSDHTALRIGAGG